MNIGLIEIEHLIDLKLMRLCMKMTIWSWDSHFVVKGLWSARFSLVFWIWQNKPKSNLNPIQTEHNEQWYVYKSWLITWSKASYEIPWRTVLLFHMKMIVGKKKKVWSLCSVVLFLYHLNNVVKSPMLFLFYYDILMYCRRQLFYYCWLQVISNAS